FEDFHMVVRPGDGKGTYKSSPALTGLNCALRLKFLLNLLHGHSKVLRGTGPSSGVDAWGAIESCCRKAAVSGKGGGPSSGGGGARLQNGVGREAVSGFLRLIKTEIACGDHINTKGGHEFSNLAELSRIVGGDDQSLACQTARVLRRHEKPQMRGSANS